MKKYVLFLLTVLLLALSACNTQGSTPGTTEESSNLTEDSVSESEAIQYFDDFSVLVVGGDIESECGVSGHGEIELGASSWIDEQALKERTISWNGESVILSYVETCSEYLYQETYHVYENREKRVRIRVNTFNDEITFFTTSSPIPVNPEHPVYTEQELYEVAYAFLCDKVSDPENYQITDRELFVEDGLSDELMIEFSRVVEGIPTSDSILVYASNGQVSFYKMQCLELMDKIPPLTAEQLSKIENAVIAKVEHLYQSIESKYEYTHLDTTYKILRMSDGRMAIRCYPVVEVVNSETETSVKDILDMIVYLN
ncbi:MAG: hypothetical protein IJW70_12025 [Clostridia bacterium]|nr:hypothetical protein [Clostridia bacterium]MBQ7380392.1 hypothetical protein [Clostridia bacterium]